MYQVGEFSRIGKVSTKMLRHYDKIGLIKPKYTNPDNGYRFYSKDQIKDILLVNKLKRYNFSLDEIREVLEKEDIKYLKVKVNQKIEDLKAEIKANYFILESMQEDYISLEKGEDIMTLKREFDIVVDDLKPIRVLSIRKTVSMDEISNVIGELFSKMYRNNVNPAGEIMTIYYDQDFDPDNADLEVCIPVNKEVKVEGLNNKMMEGGLHAHTTFVGAYSELGEGYSAMIDWIKENNYKSIRPPFEKYIKGPEARCNPKEFITEIYFPVEKM